MSTGAPGRRVGRRALLAHSMALCAWPMAACAAPCVSWPLWKRFQDNHISADARVQDTSQPHPPTVSEGQAYAMFFALVAGDQAQFSALLRWTQNNLAQGDLNRFSPGWHWGRSDTGRWGLLDSNPASDADLWMAYTLLEAGRLWQDDNHTRLGQAMAARLLRETVAVLPGLGRSLLPAPIGFQLGPERWRLNPSYAPLPLLRRLAVTTGQGEWLDMVAPTLRLLLESAPRGIAPEWAIWDTGAGWLSDPQSQGMGSYNAIRTYLWTSLSLHDPAFEQMALSALPWLHWVAQHGHAPEALCAALHGCGNPATRAGPPGFDAAAMALAHSLRFPALSQRLRARLDASLASGSPGYYSHALALFALGWTEGRFRFAPDGALMLPGQPCTLTTH